MILYCLFAKIFYIDFKFKQCEKNGYGLCP